VCSSPVEARAFQGTAPEASVGVSHACPVFIGPAQEGEDRSAIRVRGSRHAAKGSFREGGQE